MTSREAAAPLCVFVPEVGLASETFLRWDASHLLPGRTAVIADPPPNGSSIVRAPVWSVSDQPSLVFQPVAGDPAPSSARVKAVRQFIREHHVEVVLIEYLDFADRWFDHLHGMGVRIWLRGHGVDLSARLRDPAWIAKYRRYTAAAGIIVPSEATARALRSIGLPRQLIHPVAHRVAIPRRPANRGVPRLRCVAVGRLVPKKAPTLMLEAFARAHQMQPQLSLDIVGDGPLADDVARFVDAHDLRSSVHLHGELAHRETLRIARRCDIFLHHAVTSTIDGDSEGQPVALLEAMAAGLAIVTTRHAGIPEVIAEGVSGRLVPEHGVAEMGRVILELANDPAQCDRLGRAARAHIRAHHTTRRSRAHLLRLLGLSEAGQ